jgi:hypothetical protein
LAVVVERDLAVVLLPPTAALVVDGIAVVVVVTGDPVVLVPLLSLLS